MIKRHLDDRQLPLILPESNWVGKEFFPSLQDYPEIGFDTETHDPGLERERGSSWALGEGKLLGFTISTSDFSKYYPIAHPEDNIDGEKALAWLRHEFKTYKETIVGQNLMYDLGWSDRVGVVAPIAKFYDCMFGAALLDEYRPHYDLSSLAVGYGLPPKDEGLLREAAACYGVDPKAGLWRLPARFVGPYAERDGMAPLEIRSRQLVELEAEDLLAAVKLEHQLLPLNVLMRKRGIPVLMDKVEQNKKLLLQKEQEQLDLIKDMTGCVVEIWSAASLAAAFRTAGVPYETTDLDQPSFQKEWLDNQKSPLPTAVRRARIYNKARRDFVEAMIEGHLGKDGHIHPEMHPLRSEEGGTVGGRFSYTDPNLQQAPARDEEIGPLVRSQFGTQEGRWCVFDVRQQEPFFTVHYASLLGLLGAEAAVNAILANPEIDYHMMVSEMTGIPRPDAKILNLAKAYNMGGAKLCRKLGLPTEIWEKTDPATGITQHIAVAGTEGKKIIRQYDERFPFIKKLNEFCQNLALERGWIKLLDGRRCRFSTWESKGYKRGKSLPFDQAVKMYGGAENIQRAYAHKAMNRLIQGSSAVMLKKALLKIWQETGIVPLLSIHDEVDCVLETDEEIRRVDECIRTAVKLKVPLLTDIEVGSTWGETKPMIWVNGKLETKDVERR